MPTTEELVTELEARAAQVHEKYLEVEGFSRALRGERQGRAADHVLKACDWLLKAKHQLLANADRHRTLT